MTYRVGPKGQVVIPKALRDQLGIATGDEVDVELQGEGVLIRLHRASSAERRQRIAELRGSVTDPGAGTAALEAERRRDRELEERKDRERF